MITRNQILQRHWQDLMAKQRVAYHQLGLEAASQYDEEIALTLEWIREYQKNG